MATERCRFAGTARNLIFMSRIQILCCFAVTLVSVTNTEHFTITRGFTENGSNKLEDIFTFPSGSQCHKDSNVCSKFDASKWSRKTCLCECPRNKTTFQLHNGKWKCIDNSDIRTPEDCRYSFNRAQKEVLNAPLRVVDKNFFSYLYPARDVRRWKCSLAGKKAFYKLCSRGWKSLSSPMAYFNLFVMQGTNYYGFQVNGVGRSQFPELDGKIIKLFIQCKQKSSVSSGCLLFKMKGSFNCSDTTPTVATTVSTSTPMAGLDNATTSTMLPTTSHNDSNSDIDNTADSPGDTQSPLTAVTAGVVSAVVLFLVMLATVAMFLVRRGKLRREAASPKDLSGDATESEYCDPVETCTTTHNSGLENKSVSNEIYVDANLSHTYQPLIKAQGRNEGDYQSLQIVKTPAPEDDPVYSSPYQVYDLTPTAAKDGKKDDNFGITCGQLPKESCGYEMRCQTDNGYEVPINSELPDYVVVI